MDLFSLSASEEFRTRRVQLPLCGRRITLTVGVPGDIHCGGIPDTSLGTAASTFVQSWLEWTPEDEPCLARGQRHGAGSRSHGQPDLGSGRSWRTRMAALADGRAPNSEFVRPPAVLRYGLAPLAVTLAAVVQFVLIGDRAPFILI